MLRLRLSVVSLKTRVLRRCGGAAFGIRRLVFLFDVDVLGSGGLRESFHLISKNGVGQKAWQRRDRREIAPIRPKSGKAINWKQGTKDLNAKGHRAWEERAAAGKKVEDSALSIESGPGKVRRTKRTTGGPPSGGRVRMWIGNRTPCGSSGSTRDEDTFRAWRPIQIWLTPAPTLHGRRPRPGTKKTNASD